MWEIGHGTEPFRGCFQLLESCADLINDVLQGWECQIRELFFAYFFPDMFHWIQLGTIGRLRDQTNIAWHRERFGPMPACPIHEAGQ